MSIYTLIDGTSLLVPSSLQTTVLAGIARKIGQ